MKIIIKHLTLILFAGIASFMVSCGDDEIETITIKRVGGLKVKVMNGEQPVTNTDVKFFNANSNHLILTSTTNDKGIVHLSEMLEGDYAISIEINEPEYRSVYQEVQVISGESREEIVHVNEHVGSLSVLLIDQAKKTLIKEELNTGIALVPRNHAFENAFSDRERISLATKIKYFEANGELLIDDIPTGIYAIYRVKADTIESYLEEYYYINRNTEKVYQLNVNLKEERIFSKGSWQVGSVSNINDGTVVSDFPITSFKFYRSRTDGHKFQMVLDNGVIFSGDLILYDDGEFNFYNVKSSDPDFSYTLYTDLLNFNEAGELIMETEYFGVGNNSGTYNKYFYNVRLKLQ